MWSVNRKSKPQKKTSMFYRHRFSKFFASGLLSLFCTTALAQAPEMKSIDVGVGPGWAAGGHAVIAQKKGFFAQEGLDSVNLKIFPAGMMQLEGMISGAVHFSNPTQAPLLTLRSNRLPVVVLSSLAVADRTTGLVVKESLNIENPKQLEGLKLGLLKGSPAEQMLQLICNTYSVDCSKIEVVNLPPPAQLASLSSGVIDGMVTWQPWIHRAQEGAKVDLVHTGTESRFPSNPGEQNRVDFTRSVLASTQDFVDENPNTVNAVLKAYIKAQEFIDDPKNYNEVVQLYSEFFKEDPELNKLLLKENRNTLALNSEYESDLKTVASFLSQTGRLRNEVDIQELTMSEPLKAIAPGLVEAPFK